MKPDDLAKFHELHAKATAAGINVGGLLNILQTLLPLLPTLLADLGVNTGATAAK